MIMKKNKIYVESYPDKIQARIEKRDRIKKRNVPSYINGAARDLVLEDLKLWRVGFLTVSFKGGDRDLHRQISEVASEWSKYGNIVFDFGYDKPTGSYRKWIPNDKSHIRVGFEYDGYWSLVGNDTMDEAIIKPGEVTLNLGNFDKQLPNNWQGTVLHEFGHALGFHHEHQSPDTECDFDWVKLYDYLGGPPNYWTKAKVDHNLRQLTEGGLTYSAHDKHSIMHYSFPAWMFLTGTKSPCYTEENYELSDEDKKMMAVAYPYKKALIAKKDLTRIEHLTELSNLEDFNKATNQIHQKHLEFYLEHGLVSNDT